ncbi:hypothetical protein AgCh_039577 [Apium graveolens]
MTSKFSTRTPIEYKNRAHKAHTNINPASSTRTPVEYRRRPSIIKNTPGGLQSNSAPPPTTPIDDITHAIRYFNNDYVSLIIAEFSGPISQGFQHLSGNHAPDVDELFALVHKLPRADGKTLSNFIRTWASISAKHLNGEYDSDNLDTLPFYDRSVIKDPKGIPSNFLEGADTYDANEVEEHFGFAIDIRSRLVPPISSNYFGHAITFREATLKTCQLVGDEGFINAVEEISKVLHEQIKYKEGGLETLFDGIEVINRVKGLQFLDHQNSSITL